MLARDEAEVRGGSIANARIPSNDPSGVLNQAQVEGICVRSEGDKKEACAQRPLRGAPALGNSLQTSAIMAYDFVNAGAECLPFPTY